jgi:hypothetical protein
MSSWGHRQPHRHPPSADLRSGSRAVSPRGRRRRLPLRPRRRRRARRRAIRSERRRDDADGPVAQERATLGIVCDALRLTLPRNRKANGRRFLTGERALSQEARIAVVRSLVEDALAAGYLGDIARAALGEERDRGIELVTSGVIILMSRWDHAVGHLAAAQVPHLERTALVTECLRSAVVGVAIRASAFARSRSCRRRRRRRAPPPSPHPHGRDLAERPPAAPRARARAHRRGGDNHQGGRGTLGRLRGDGPYPSARR